MGNNIITTLMIFVVCLNVFLWLGQLTMNGLNPGNTTQSYHCTGTLMETAGSCSTYTLSDVKTKLNDLPSADSTISGTQSNFFVDIFNSMKSWILSLPGVNMVASMISAPYNILSSMFGNSSKEYSAFIFGITSIWYIISFFSLILLIWGRQ